jgi:SAM-dependent methyltransferase
MTVLDKYDRMADRFSEHDYARPQQYAERAAALIVSLGVPLERGQSVLDLACGDGIMARPLLRRGLRYLGIDASEAMIEAARARNPGVTFAVGLLEEYEPAEPVDAAICLRAFYYAPDRAAFFHRVARYTRVKFVFDVRPVAYDVEAILGELRAAGFSRIELRPFFTPQSRSVPRVVLPVVSALERTGPLASAVARRRGRLLCAAHP